jgi:hypothetical protein
VCKKNWAAFLIGSIFVHTAIPCGRRRRHYRAPPLPPSWPKAWAQPVVSKTVQGRALLSPPRRRRNQSRTVTRFSSGLLRVSIAATGRARLARPIVDLRRVGEGEFLSKHLPEYRAGSRDVPGYFA